MSHALPIPLRPQNSALDSLYPAGRCEKKKSGSLGMFLLNRLGISSLHFCPCPTGTTQLCGLAYWEV